jgi:hypothetical protein
MNNGTQMSLNYRLVSGRQPDDRIGLNRPVAAYGDRL